MSRRVIIGHILGDDLCGHGIYAAPMTHTNTIDSAAESNRQLVDVSSLLRSDRG